jgi:hypothetical protein
MKPKTLFEIFIGLLLIVAVLPGVISPIFTADAQISPLPTSTFTPTPTDTPYPPTPTDTPLPPTPTDTPVPPTPTDTPVPPTPTDTPVPPTPTDTPFPPTPTNTPYVPIPLPPELGLITIDPPEALVPVNVPLAFTMSFTEPLPPPDILDTVTWDWGDGTTSICPPNSEDCIVDPGNGMVGTVSASHAYSQPGVYTVQVTVEDIFGQFDTATHEFVTVYDPAAGFVTGGGWIDSWPGAYKDDPTLAGKATFGFVSKYKKGSSRPTGNTTFQFKVADLKFYSDTYHWLVVNRGGTNAQFRGEGTINGFGTPDGGLYRFMIWAADGQASEEPDTFRIRIWWEDEFSGMETGIYDNGFSQPIGGGNIHIQR